MYTEDFIRRMIGQAVAVLAQMAGLRRAQQYEQAQQAIDQSLEQLFGLRADMIKQLDDEVIFRTLTLQDRLDTERVFVMAQLFKSEGDILSDQNRQDESQQSYLRALNFYLEAGLSEQLVPQPDRLVQQVEWLASLPGLFPLPDDTQWSLFTYYEQSRNYNKAEAALAELANRPGLYADLRPELVGFYQRLLALPPAELIRAHLDRNQIQEKLDKV